MLRMSGRGKSRLGFAENAERRAKFALGARVLKSKTPGVARTGGLTRFKCRTRGPRFRALAARPVLCFIGETSLKPLCKLTTPFFQFVR